VCVCVCKLGCDSAPQFYTLADTNRVLGKMIIIY